MKLARAKALVFATLGTITAALYFGTLHVPLFTARVLTPTAVDAAIPFVPLFVVPFRTGENCPTPRSASG